MQAVLIEPYALLHLAYKTCDVGPERLASAADDHSDVASWLLFCRAKRTITKIMGKCHLPTLDSTLSHRAILNTIHSHRCFLI